MYYTRVNIGITEYINNILNKAMKVNKATRSRVIRTAVTKYYTFDLLEPIHGPYTKYIRVNIPRVSIGHIRKIAHENNIPLSSVYCAIINRYLHTKP